MDGIVQELAAPLVGGSAARRDSSSHSTGNRSAAKKTHELVTKHHGLSKSDQVFHNIADGTIHKTEIKVAAKATAEKAIPMNNDNSSSDDLNEFNSELELSS